MPHHSTSPLDSEKDYDITNSISQIEPTGSDNTASFQRQNQLKFDAGQILDLFPEVEEDDDEAFIEFQKAALNKRSSNIKGKSVKKGGGFQAMGW